MHYCEFHFTGREFTVLIPLALIRGLQKDISRDSGLLLGRGNEGAAIVSGCVPQPGRNSVRNKDQFWTQFASSLPKLDGQLGILGYYRVTSGAEPVPDESDLRIMREFLPESARLLFLIGASEGKVTGSAFIWAKNESRLLASQTKVQFPNPSSIQAAPRDCIDYPGYAVPTSGSIAQTSGPDVPNILQEQSLPAAGKNRFRRIPLAFIPAGRRWPLVWALAVGLAAIPLWRAISTRQSHPQSSQTSSVRQIAKPLALAASIENGNLRVTWDTTSPSLASASSAVLSITPDRGTPDTQVLGRNQLMTGSATFKLPPEHAKVSLVVFTQEMSEVAPRSDTAWNSQPPAPIAALSRRDSSTVVNESLRLPPDKSQVYGSRDGIASPAKRMSMKRESDVKPMIVGFRDEIWRDRWRGASGSTRVPPRPIRLVHPDRYYNLYPFTLDSVQINVRVKINTFGEVTSAEPLSWGNALLNHLSSIAVRAARESTFLPARFENHNVPSTAVLSYRFLRKK